MRITDAIKHVPSERHAGGTQLSRLAVIVQRRSPWPKVPFGEWRLSSLVPLPAFDLSVMGQAVAKPKAQHPPVNQVRPQPREVEVEAPPPIGEPLRPDLKELPAAYAGDSIQAVADGLRPAEKGEFETTAQYNARVEALRPTRTYSFWVNGQISRRYDADRQVLKIQGPVSSCTYFGVVSSAYLSVHPKRIR